MNALVYAEIENNLTSTNYPNYNYLLKGTGAASGNALNDILSKTTIKKACCAVSSSDDGQYQVEVPIFDEKGNTKNYIVQIDKKMCDDLNIYPGLVCEKFRTLYCENSNYLYRADNSSNDQWDSYSPFCSSYELIANKSDADANANANANANSNVSGFINNQAQLAQPTQPQTQTQPQPQDQTQPQTNDFIKNNKNYIIGGILTCCCIIIMLVVMMVVMKK